MGWVVGQDFPYLSRLALGPTQSPIQWGPGLSQGQAARVLTTLPFTTKVKERVEL